MGDLSINLIIADDDPNAEQKYTNMTYSVQIFHLHAKDVPIDTVRLIDYLID